MSNKTGLDIDRVDALETFKLVCGCGDRVGPEMKSDGDGKWVKLSDVQAMWIEFMMDLGETIIGIGTDLKIEATDALQDDRIIKNRKNSHKSEHSIVVNGIRINIPKIAEEHVDITTQRLVEAINACPDMPFIASIDPCCPPRIVFNANVPGCSPNEATSSGNCSE